MGIKSYDWRRKSEFDYRSRSRYAANFGAWTYTSSENGKTFTSRYSNSQSTPNFKKVKRTSLPLHPYEMYTRYSQYDWTSSQALWIWSDGSSGESQYMGHSDNWGVNVDVTFEKYYPNELPIDNQAKSRLFDDLSQTKGSAAVTMAEIDKTAKMVADTATKFAKAFTAARKGDFGKFADALGFTPSRRHSGAMRSRFSQQRGNKRDAQQFAAQTWLEFTYGWKPLISDVYTQAENLANYLTDRQCIIRTARGSAKDKRVTIEEPTNTSGWRIHKVVNAELRVGYVVNYTFADGGNSIVNVFGLNNPAIVAWELLPYSFVVDWFLPIGNFLQQLTATAGLRFHSGVKTRKLHDTATGWVTNPKPKPDQGGTLYDTITGGGTASHENLEKHRELLTSFPSPIIPVFKNPASVSHALSSLSLMKQAFGR